MRLQRLIWVVCVACLFAAIAVPGYRGATREEFDDDEIGPRGGPVAEWKDYHAEFTVDHAAKTATIYILDDKLKDIKLDSAKVTKASLKITSAKPEVTIELKYDPKLSGEKMTVFVGSNDVLSKKGDIEGIIKATIGKKTYSAPFTYDLKKKKAKTTN